MSNYFNITIDDLLGNSKTLTEEDYIKKLVKYERLENSLKQAGLKLEDLEKLSPEQMKLISDVIKQLNDK